MYLNFFSWFLEGLFPPSCLTCGKEGLWLCGEHNNFTKAPESQAVFEHLDSIHAATAYKKEPSKKVVNSLKVSGNKSMGLVMACEMLKECPYDLVNGVLVPVPLHWSRFLIRGFNQSSVIAKAVIEISGNGKIRKLVKRKKRTKHQSLMNRVQRLENLEGVFEVFEEGVPETVVLVDDVVATGSTLDQLAKVLKEKGVKNVYGLVFARGGSVI